MIRIRCPHCRSKVRGGDDWVGRTGKCPRCAGAITFPGLARPEGVRPTTSTDIELESKSTYLPMIESWIQDFAVFFVGCVGYLILHQTIREIWTGEPMGIITANPFFADSLRAKHPILSWLKSVGAIVIGAVLMRIGIAGAIGLYRDFVASIPRRFRVRTLLVIMSVGAFVAWLIGAAFRNVVATVADPSNVWRMMLVRIAVLLLVGTFGLFILGSTWVEHTKGSLYLRGWYVDRASSPRWFLVLAILRYLIALAFLMAAIWFFLRGFAF